MLIDPISIGIGIGAMVGNAVYTTYKNWRTNKSTKKKLKEHNDIIEEIKTATLNNDTPREPFTVGNNNIRTPSEKSHYQKPKVFKWKK